ncbi:hypothetical protein O3P69_014405 [Scylla paramamosain]|uniref:Reverse transcriptase domain-containing protein n=1 Tax=Scylla paramamosain TaxID=85552 RepID=A0AAW0TBT5_SCYPA
MGRVLEGLPGCVAYLDDLFVTRENNQDLAEKLDGVLRRMKHHGIRLKEEKCQYVVELRQSGDMAGTDALCRMVLTDTEDKRAHKVEYKTRKSNMLYLHEGHSVTAAEGAVATWRDDVSVREFKLLTRDSSACVEKRPAPPRSAIHPWERTKGSWHIIHVDLTGPVTRDMQRIVADSFSKWIEAISMKSTSSVRTITKFRATATGDHRSAAELPPRLPLLSPPLPSHPDKANLLAITAVAATNVVAAAADTATADAVTADALTVGSLGRRSRYFYPRLASASSFSRGFTSLLVDLQSLRPVDLQCFSHNTIPIYRLATTSITSPWLHATARHRATAVPLAPNHH